MFGLSRLISLMIVFCMGFGLAAGLFVGIPAAVIASYSLRDLENTNLVNIPDEKFLLPDAPVDILDLNGIELYYEIKELQTFGDDLTLNLLKSRYGILFHEKLEIIMTDEAMNMPIKQLFSMDGLHAVLKNVYIGNIEGFQCMNADGSPDGDPKAEGAYWVNKEGNQITALEEIIADFTLDDFISGNINTDSILHGDITLADILGYRYDNERKCWIDGSGEKVVGIMSVFADCTLDTVDDKINDAYIGELIGYEKVYTGIFGEDGEEEYYWASTNEETHELEPVTGIMKAVAGRTVSSLGGLYDDLTVGDLVPEEQRTGLFSIISSDTKLDGIAPEINKKIKNSPLQFYMNEQLISFADQEVMLDGICATKGYYVYFNVSDEDFETNKAYYEFNNVEIWEQVGEGEYRVEEWRAKALNESFSYILNLVTESLTPPTP